MRAIKLDAETVDRIMIDGLRNTRADMAADKSRHPEDVAANRLRISAIDLIIGYMGAGEVQNSLFGEAAE